MLALNAIATIRRGKPISVRTISELLGVTRRTIFSWMSQTRWHRTLNYAVRQPAIDPRVLSLADKYADRPRRFKTMRLRNGEMYLVERLPNTLIEAAERKNRRAALRRVNRRLQPCGQRGRGQQQAYVIPGGRRTLPLRLESYHLDEKLSNSKFHLWTVHRGLIPL